MRNKATINDVAKLAEVSVATVSYVLNKNPKKSISAETTKRVLEAAKQLNYISNSAAKTLQSNRTNCIGVFVYQSLTLPRHAQILQGMINALQEQSYSILICTSRIMQNGYPEYLSAYFSHMIDGVVYLGADSSALEPEIENIVVERRIPFVVCDCETNRNISSVVIDYFNGAYEMTKFMIENKGVKRIFYARPSIDNRQEREREQGVRRAVFEHPGTQMETIIFTPPFYPYNKKTDYPDDLKNGIKYRDDLLKSNFDYYFDYYLVELKSRIGDIDSESGLICSWSGLDQPSLRILRENNISIPIATLAQGALSDKLFPNLLYSYLPNLDIGRTCAGLILNLLDDENDIRHEVIRPSLTPIINETLPNYFLTQTLHI